MLLQRVTPSQFKRLTPVTNAVVFLENIEKVFIRQVLVHMPWFYFE